MCRRRLWVSAGSHAALEWHAVGWAVVFPISLLALLPCLYFSKHFRVRRQGQCHVCRRRRHVDARGPGATGNSPAGKAAGVESARRADPAGTGNQRPRKKRRNWTKVNAELQETTERLKAEVGGTDTDADPGGKNPQGNVDCFPAGRHVRTWPPACCTMSATC